MARTASNDPLEKFRFLVQVVYPGAVNQTPTTSGGTAVAFTKLGFHDIQVPKRTTSKISYREGHNPDIHALSPGLNTMEDVVMSRGLLSSASGVEDFYKWIALVHVGTQGISGYTAITAGTVSQAEGSIDFRGQVTITQLDRSGNVARQWQLYNAWPTHFTPGSDLNAGEDGEKSIEALTLAYEDFQEINPTTNLPVVNPPQST